ncbi:MAG: cysteine synthase A [Hyphomicrobiaceae bacterium]
MNKAISIKTIDGFTQWGRGRVFDDISQTIGNTPIVRVNRTAAEAGARAEVLLKLEFFNPLSSVKDRIGVSLIDSLTAEGRIGPDTVLIEPTSGNTGIALAFVAAARGLKLVLVMPESMSIERRKLLAYLGAGLELTPAEKGMKGAIARAEEMVATNPKAILVGQFINQANPEVHVRTTAEEIWKDTGGRLDALVVGVGTGGTLTGCARVLKERIPHLQVIAVEPTASPVISGGAPGPHKIQGIGAGFIPPVLDKERIDEVVKVENDDAFKTSRQLARLDGIPGGISTGANVWAALQVAARPDMAGKRVLTFAPSFAERYLSTALFEGV